MTTHYSLDFEYAWGRPECEAGFRVKPEDFIVEEQMGIELSGEGEHLWLHIKKIGENTDWVAGKLAQYFDVKKMDVGYAGKKDRHAVTSQWFSIYLPGKPHDLDWSVVKSASEFNVELLDCGTHSKKLKVGDHKANRFEICLRDLVLDDALEARLKNIKSHGVPNYFGEQRFGREAGNLERVVRWVKDTRSVRDRNLRGILMSAARSYLFNLVLSQRVADNSWLQKLDGDPEVNASGPLWGRGRSLAQDQCLALEDAALSEFSSWTSALENVGLMQQRRALVLLPENFSWSTDGNNLIICMDLEPGQFATSVLREITLLKQPQR